MTRILITGVRGKTGVPLARSLLAHAGTEVRGGSSNPSAITLGGVQPVAFSWDDPAGWAGALDGVDSVYLVRPDREDAPDLVAALLSRTPRDTRIVLLSGLEASAAGPDRWALRVEELVQEGREAWTILRPSWFMQVFDDQRFFREEILERGRLPFASGGATVAWIDARDIAAVAERALLDNTHTGQVLELSGPEALTLPQTADALSTALDRSVSHDEITIAEAVAETAQGFERDQFRSTLQHVRDGVFSRVTNTVEQVTGRRPRGVAQFHAD